MIKKIAQHLGYLFDRWQDEKEYEDFSDYVASMKKIIEGAGGKFVKMTKSPFRVTFIDDKGEAQLKATRKNILLYREQPLEPGQKS